MLQWIFKIQIIDAHYLGNWSGSNESPKWSPKMEKTFAWYPVKLDDGDVIFKHYWVNETFMQNPIMVQKDTW